MLLSKEEMAEVLRAPGLATNETLGKALQDLTFARAVVEYLVGSLGFGMINVNLVQARIDGIRDTMNIDRPWVR